jgi:hypothetical protein
MFAEGARTLQRQLKFKPIRIALLDPRQLPLTPPLLHLVLGKLRLDERLIFFELDKFVDAIPRREAGVCFRLVLMNAPGEIVRDTQIDCAVGIVSQHVKPIALMGHEQEDIARFAQHNVWIPGSHPLRY